MDHAAQYHIFETAHGVCGIGWRGDAIVRFCLAAKTADAAERLMLRRLPDARPADPVGQMAEAIAAAKRYFAGEQIDFSRFNLDLSGESAFFRRIYETLRDVGWGRTTTYGALAKALGAGPEAARDVGEAMARNPVPLIVPCHRVLAAGGKIGGFSAPGGSQSKARMLALEGVNVAPPAPAQQAFGF